MGYADTASNRSHESKTAKDSALDFQSQRIEALERQIQLLKKQIVNKLIIINNKTQNVYFDLEKDKIEINTEFNKETNSLILKIEYEE